MNHDDTLKLRPLDLDDLSALEVHFAIDDGGDVLVVTFLGEYRPGSQGTPDASYMNAMIAAGIKAYDPIGLILNLSEFHYEWGNSLLCIFDTIATLMPEKEEPDEPEAPWSIVAGPRCRHALLSLVRAQPDASPPWMFDTLNDALVHSQKACRAWLDYI